MNRISIQNIVRERPEIHIDRHFFRLIGAVLVPLLFVNGWLNAQETPQLDIPQHAYYICSEEPVDVDIYVLGESPVYIIYVFEEDTLVVNSSSERIRLRISEPGTYHIIEYGDMSASVTDQPDFFTIALNPAPSLEFTGGGINCSDGYIDPLVIHFTGEPPFILDFLFNEDTLQIQTVNTQLTFPTDQSYTIRTLYLSDNLCGTEVVTEANYIYIDVPHPVITGDTSLCQHETELYFAGETDYRTEWDIPSGGNYIEGVGDEGRYVAVTWTEPGNHQVFLRYIEEQYNCETEWEVLPVSVFEGPGTGMVLDTTVCFELGEQLTIELTVSDGDEVFWPELNLLAPLVNLTVEGTFTYIHMNQNNCSDTGRVVVSSNCFSDIHVPEAFTPNGDNLNDYLELFGLFTELDFRVYSPSGILLFQTSQADQPWDGRHEGSDVPAGSYCWHAIISNGDSERKEKSGVVTIIR